MRRVFVLDNHKQPLMPCVPARARQLLKKGKASVYRRFPFTIILNERVGGSTQPTEAKFDPGSKTTGISLVAHGKTASRVVWAGELTHRSWSIVDALNTRRNLRKFRRYRKTRYRQPRFLNRTRKDGWLPPSIQSRVDNIVAITRKLQAFTPLSLLACEVVKFDTQKLRNPEIEGTEYQRGTLFGFEVWEYLLTKWNYSCAYCNAKNTPLEKEHVVAKSKGGSNSVTNLVVSCRHCNENTMTPLLIKANGRGSRRMCQPDGKGFPKHKPKSVKRVKGFQTGDIVKAIVTKGIKQGVYVGNVSIRKTGSFNIKTKDATIQGINHKYCNLLQRTDGYEYA